MEKEEMMRIEELKQRIARDEYTVDPVVVANAIVERTLARHRDALESVNEQVALPRHRRSLR